MNTSNQSLRQLLLGSAIVNLVLAGWILGTQRHEKGSAAIGLEATPAATSSESAGQDFVGLPLRAEAIGSGLWARIESTNYVEYVRNLRAIGCPENTIIDILTADVGELFAEYRATAKETGRHRGDPQKKVAAEVAALERREGEVLTELLGEGWRKSRRSTDDDGWVGLDWMSLNTADQVRGIEERAEAEAEAVRSKARLAVTSEDRSILNAIEQRRREELLAVLGAEGMSEYLFETSGSAEVLADLPGIRFENRAEMRRVFEIESDAERQLESEPEGEEREERQRQVESKKVQDLKDLLGEQRYAQLERARDSRFQQLHAVSERFGLGDAVAQSIYELHRGATAGEHTEMGWANELTDKTRSEVEALLGQKAFAVYSAVVKEW